VREATPSALQPTEREWECQKTGRAAEIFPEKRKDQHFEETERKIRMQKHRQILEKRNVFSRLDMQSVAVSVVKGGMVSVGATTGGVAGCVGGGGTGAAVGFCLAGPAGAAVGYLFGLGFGTLGGALGGGLATQKVVSRLGI
jgi:hypothetical protein